MLHWVLWQEGQVWYQSSPRNHPSSALAAFADQTVCGRTSSPGRPGSHLWLNRENPGAHPIRSASHGDTPLSYLFSRNKQMMVFFLTNSLEAPKVRALFPLQVHVGEHWIILVLENGSSAQSPAVPAPRAAPSSYQGAAVQLRVHVLGPWVLKK